MLKMGNKRLFFLMFGIILFIAIMGITLGNREKVTLPEKFLADTVSFAQGLLYKPAGYAAGLFEDMRNLRVVFEENKILKRTLADFVRVTAERNYLQEQNERLLEALQFTERQKRLNRYTWRIAQVVSVSPDPNNRTFRIDLGEKDGIRENMAVATIDGLIGRIVRVTSFYAHVQLISDINVSVNKTKAVAATVLGKERSSFGMIESYEIPDLAVLEKFNLPEREYLVMNRIDAGDPMKVGDTVVTSGLGHVFPPGIVIGTVVSREVGSFGLTHTALIEPAADLANMKLREVFVVEVPKL